MSRLCNKDGSALFSPITTDLWGPFGFEKAAKTALDGSFDALYFPKAPGGGADVTVCSYVCYFICHEDLAKTYNCKASDMQHQRLREVAQTFPLVLDAS